MRIGLQLTNNTKKYKKLLNILKSNLNEDINIKFTHIPDNQYLIDNISNIDVLTTYSISEKIFSYATEKLKWIHFGAAGIEKSLSPSILKSKTIITNASGIHSNPVSEFVLGMILYLSKNFNGCEKFKINKIWSQWELAKTTIQLKKKTIGIIGFGNIGKAVAKKCKAFDMKVIATRRLQKNVESKKNVDKLIPISELNYLLRKSDFIVIACPLTPTTKRLISKDQLNKMKSTAFLINIARGPIIDQNELINALKTKKIAGAAIDVFENEPLNISNPLFKIDNVFLSPHISGNFPEYQTDVVLQFADNLNRFINGKILKNRVCKKRLY